MDMYKKIKKQNGEKFAQAIRAHHNGIFEISELDKILRHAGRDAEPLLPYLTGLLINDDTPEIETEPEDPFILLDRAGYEAFYADTLKKQNSIKHHFAGSEQLCTFNDYTRYKKYYIVHAVKKDVDKIKREDFKGKERREDKYGTSVISIQMLKTGGFISIKNRYNHTVASCDNTFGSNPDMIIEGLSKSLKEHFNVDFKASSFVPESFILIDGQIFKYHQEIDGTYYGDNVWAKDGKITVIDKSKGDALFGYFLFDSKRKILKKIDSDLEDSFADDFNCNYGGNRGLTVKNGNLTLNGKILIGAKNSVIKTIDLPKLTKMNNNFFRYACDLIEFKAATLTIIGDNCLFYAPSLAKFKAPALTQMGDRCLYNAQALIEFKASQLKMMGVCCLYKASILTEFKAPALTTMGNYCLYKARSLTEFKASPLIQMGNGCLYFARSLKEFKASASTMPVSHNFKKAFI